MSELADREFWARYWKARNPVRTIDRGFYFARLLDDVLAGLGGKTFIELGGFPGHFAVYVRRFLGLQPTLVDSYIDPVTIRALLLENGLAANDVECVEGDVLTFEPAKRYDVVLSAGLVEHFEDSEAILRRHLDFLAPGGTLLVTVPNYLGVNGWLQRRFDPDHLAAHNLAAMDVDRLADIVDSLGLASAHVERFGRFRVWLEDLGKRPPGVRMVVYGIQALGIPIDLLGIRSRLTTPHVAIVGRAPAD